MAIDIIETWANTGDISIIPDEVQPDGSVSFKQGWGNDYQLDPATVSNAKKLSRSNFNYLFSLLTTNQQEQLLYGFNNHIVGKTYPAMARVRGTDGLIYESTVETNTTPPSADWIEFGATDEYALLNGDENETFKVANATANNEAVNFSQVLGIGQTWQEAEFTNTGATFTDGTPKFRQLGIEYVNTTGKPIQLSITARDSNSGTIGSITINDDVVIPFSYNIGNYSFQCIWAVIPDKTSYKIALSNFDGFTKWVELR